MADAWRVVVTVDARDVELVSDALWELGALGIEERDARATRVTLLAAMPDRGSALAATREVPHSSIEQVRDDTWADTWRSWAKPSRVRDVVLQPAWLDVDRETAGAAVVVTIEPGRSFGSGAHESTRLALSALLDYVPSRGTVLDVGCGSGVLAVAAAVVRGVTVVAIDVDEHAVSITEANARGNGVGASIDASTTRLADITRQFDVVVANLLPSVLCELGEALATRVRPGGTLILSGMLHESVADVLAVYVARGWPAAAITEEGDWSAAVLRET